MPIVCDIALAFALLVVGFNVAMYACRARVRRRLPECEAGDVLGVATAAGVFVKECLALATVILLIPIGWIMPRCRAAAGARGSVILVHGWGLNRGSLWWLRRRLLRDGWSPVCCFGYRSFSADVERAARELRTLVDALTPQPVMLVGHSFGGLVLRYYARRYPAPRVRRIVTLGTPHAGPELARLLGPAGRHLRPGSALLNQLHAVDRVPQQFDVIAISSTFDAMILPPTNGRYPGAFNIELNDVGHNALLLSRKVYQLIAENLAAPLP